MHKYQSDFTTQGLSHSQEGFVADALPKLRHRFSVHSFLQNVSDYSFKMTVSRFIFTNLFLFAFLSPSAEFREADASVSRHSSHVV